jgi:hypothetical protein
MKMVVVVLPLEVLPLEVLVVPLLDPPPTPPTPPAPPAPPEAPVPDFPLPHDAAATATASWIASRVQSARERREGEAIVTS